jgi:chemotaxis protein MotB
MSSRAKKNSANHERWLVSYADFITLLFAFFVVLYAFAKDDQKKHMEVSAAIDSSFHSLGLFPGSLRLPDKHAAIFGGNSLMTPADIYVCENQLTPAAVKNNLEQMRRSLERSLSDQIENHTISIHLGADGLVISLREAGFFNSGSALPRKGTLNILRQIATTLNNSPYYVRVEGHTDNVPIHNDEFDSNWELSSARATRIARILLALHAIPPDRLAAAGYAEFHPIASNQSAAGRAENRRVDLVVMPRVEFKFGPTSQSESTFTWARVTDQSTVQKSLSNPHQAPLR